MKKSPDVRLHRRAFLTTSAAALGSTLVGCRADPELQAPPSDGWDAGEVLHLLPTADHERILLKASLRSAIDAPQLHVDGRKVPGRRTDSAGTFHRFDVRKLAPDTEYSLRLHRSSGEALCEAWPLRTFPAPDSHPDHFRLLAYTCAGGPDQLYNFGGWNAYLPIPHRQRLLARALSFAPHAVVANGDHVYWDLESKFGWAMGRSPRAWWLAGLFERGSGVLGTPNETVLKRAFGPQIAGLYGVLFRSIPTYFLQDDHDYGENDEASDELRTFPADQFMLDLARTTQQLYYPELLAGPGLPPRHVDRSGLATSFGSLRYGRLFEGLLYDCRRHLSNAVDADLGHTDSRFVPADAERWLLERTAASPCDHLAHMPSTPILWTAGKWLEWYPDFKDEDGVLGVKAAKPYWAEGWRDQHDRLLATAHARDDRIPLFVSGDLHATAAGFIDRSGGLDLTANPVVSVLSGAIGTGYFGWPSQFRGQIPLPSRTVESREIIEPIEENGFSLLEFTKSALRISFFRWRPEQGVEAIDSLEPFHILEVPRPHLR